MKTTVETAQTQIRASGKGSPTGSDWLLLCSVSFEFGSATSAKLPQPDVWSNTDPSGFVGVKLRATVKSHDKHSDGVSCRIATSAGERTSLGPHTWYSRGLDGTVARHLVVHVVVHRHAMTRNVSDWSPISKHSLRKGCRSQFQSQCIRSSVSIVVCE